MTKQEALNKIWYKLRDAIGNIGINCDENLYLIDTRYNIIKRLKYLTKKEEKIDA